QQLDQVLRASGGEFTDHDLVRMAMYFGVSGPALSLRLVALRQMPRAIHDRFWRTAGTFKRQAKLLGYAVEDQEPIWERPVVLPRRFRYLALKAYEREIISISKLAELLREDSHTLRQQLDSASGAQTSPS